MNELIWEKIWNDFDWSNLENIIKQMSIDVSIYVEEEISFEACRIMDRELFSIVKLSIDGFI